VNVNYVHGKIINKQNFSQNEFRKFKN
jgi:hypothetical protein